MNDPKRACGNCGDLFPLAKEGCSCDSSKGSIAPFEPGEKNSRGSLRNGTGAVEKEEIGAGSVRSETVASGVSDGCSADGSSGGEVLPSELHPLEPFLPAGARLLMLGSFPPQRKRWSMDFFYPNLQNDMWRIVGAVFFGDRAYFLDTSGRRFDKERIAAFCSSKGIALYDTAVEIIRLKDNASDDFLKVVREVDLAALLARIPACRAIVTTGRKATETLRAVTGCGEPPVGGSVEFSYAGRTMRLYRMPSSSRAYPRPVEWKADFYRPMFAETVGI